MREIPIVRSIKATCVTLNRFTSELEMNNPMVVVSDQTVIRFEMKMLNRSESFEFFFLCATIFYRKFHRITGKGK